MKWVTFTVAFILTAALIITGIMVYPEVLGKVATTNNDFVFELFLGPFLVLLFFAWVGERVVLRVWKKKE
jgi:membrane protein DedA with SNARE-associated domain